MTEKQLQAKLILTFGQKYPQYRDLLFEVNNDTFSQHHAAARKAVGMVAGVSDLIFINPYNGKILGIELKAENSTHAQKHIHTQLNWGAQITNAGGYYILSSNIEFIMQFIDSIIKKNDLENAKLRIENTVFISQILEQIAVKKTVKF